MSRIIFIIVTPYDDFNSTPRIHSRTAHPVIPSPAPFVSQLPGVLGGPVDHKAILFKIRHSVPLPGECSRKKRRAGKGYTGRGQWIRGVYAPRIFRLPPPAELGGCKEGHIALPRGECTLTVHRLSDGGAREWNLLWAGLPSGHPGESTTNLPFSSPGNRGSPPVDPGRSLRGKALEHPLKSGRSARGTRIFARIQS